VRAPSRSRRSTRRDGEAQDAGSLHATKPGRSPGNRFRRHPALAIGRTRERQHGFLAQHQIWHFDRVADGPDARIRRAHLVIHHNAAAGANGEAGRLGEPRLRAHANGENYELGLHSHVVL